MHLEKKFNRTFQFIAFISEISNRIIQDYLFKYFKYLHSLNKKKKKSIKHNLDKISFTFFFINTLL